MRLRLLNSTARTLTRLLTLSPQPYDSNTKYKKMASENQDLLKIVRDLQFKVEKLEAEAEVRKLHHKYGYYLDKCLYKETYDLFATHPDTYVSFLGGRFRGKAGVKRLYVDRFAKTFVQGRNGPVHGFLLDHLQAQDIVDYFPAVEGEIGREHPKCKARFRALMSAGNHMSMDDNQLPRGKRQWWEGGLYENEYVRTSFSSAARRTCIKPC